jgi:hypothetical protein
MESGVVVLGVQRMKKIIRMIWIGEMLIVNDVLYKLTVDNWIRSGGDMRKMERMLVRLR